MLNMVYYAFNFNNCRFIGLFSCFNMQSIPIPTGEDSNTQISWLENELEKHSQRSKGIFLFAHDSILIPFGSLWSGWERKYLLYLIRKYKVTAYLSGHLHENHYNKRGNCLFINSNSTSVYNVDNSEPSYHIIEVQNGAICKVSRKIIGSRQEVIFEKAISERLLSSQF